MIRMNRNRSFVEKGHRIHAVQPDSIAEELELMPGDVVLAINDQEMEDVFDYRFLCQDEYVELLVRQADGEDVLFEIEKDYEEDLGIVFENGLMDEYRSCRNKCMFCFIDQMPPGMRETLYFKDDDSRLSFLQGNYVTLTNMSDADIDRIIRYRLEPINISIHTMNPELRCQMLHNRFAGDALKKLDRLYEAGIEMNGQIVLCQDINDGDELDESIRRMAAYIPYMRSVSVVPVGLTKYREGLVDLKPISTENAARTIDLVESWQKKLYAEHGLHFIHASDEFYIQTGREVPEEERYDGYLQLDNGVGSIRLLLTEFYEALEAAAGDDRLRQLTIATGRLAAPFLNQLTQDLLQKYPNIKVNVVPIRNDFFGELITVSGLITGQDLMGQLKQLQLQNISLGEELLIPLNMLRSGEQVFLDDHTLDDVKKALDLPIRVVRSEGSALLRALLGEEDPVTCDAYDAYELNEI